MQALSRKNYRMLLIATAAVLAIIAAMGLPAQAHADTPKASKGAQAHTLQLNTTYHKYDITGDGKPDTIRVSGHYSNGPYDYQGLYVDVNGERVFSSSTEYYGADIQLINLKNKKAFLYMYAWIDNGDSYVCGVYQLKKGKLKQVINCNKVFTKKAWGGKYGSHTGGTVVKVSGNAMWLDMSLMSYMAGHIDVTLEYKYKKGTLKQTSKVGKLSVPAAKNNRAKALKKMTAYTSTTGKTKKFTIKKGQTVKFLRAYVKNNKVLFQVKAGGKTGWIKAVKQGRHCDGPPFEGLFLAG